MAGVHLEGVSKSYGSVQALLPTDLTVRDGEFFSLLGPSGCGKTTTLRLMAGFMPPTTGSVFIGDRDVTRVPVQGRNIGMVFQGYALFPHMTVFENVAFGLRERHWAADDIRRRVTEALELVQLAGRAAAYPAMLSGGQQQRVGLARALAISPSVLLLDEPLGALDLKLREALQVELKRIHRELGTTTVYVTHDQAEALSMSDRVAIMNSGRMIQVGSPREVYDHPASRFVAGFVGQINLVPGTVLAAGAGLVDFAVAGLTVARVPAPAFAAAAGQPAVLALRPESVRLHDPTAAPPPPCLGGRVEAVRYAGNLTYVSTRVATGLSLTAECAGTCPASVGAEIMASWEHGQGTLLPAADTATEGFPA